mmetsp:Transcript_5658/g.13979  ORF Transcript_5658/g.13979 Transcript_5658/m.13979 type:complete len:705 (+) Transcript_5658:178-2292(+)
MPAKGRKLPTLTGQAANHLVMVYDKKRNLRYAYFNTATGQWVCNPGKEKALELSIKANGDAPDWRPPSEFSKEGHTLAIDKENVGNESAPSDQPVPHEDDPQSPLQSTPASQASGITELLSSGLHSAVKLSAGTVKKLVGSMVKQVQGMFHTAEQQNVARHEETGLSFRSVANSIANVEMEQKNAANSIADVQTEQKNAAKSIAEVKGKQDEMFTMQQEAFAAAEAERKSKLEKGLKKQRERQQQAKERLQDQMRELAAKEEENEQLELRFQTLTEGINNVMQLGKKNLETSTKNLETSTKTYEKIEELPKMLESGLANVADQFLKFGLLKKLEANQAAEKEVEEQAEATPKKSSKASAEEKKGSPILQRARQGLSKLTAAVSPPRSSTSSRGPSTRSRSGKPVADARRKPSAPTSRKPAAPAKRAPVAAPVAEIEVMSKTSPSMAAQTFGQLISTLLSINHDDWSKKVDGLLYGVFEHLERANKVGKVEAALVRLQPSLKKVIKAAEGQVVMAALTTIGKLAEKYAPHFTPTAEAILADIIVRSADTGSVNIAEAAMQTAVCVVVNAPTTNMVEIIEKLLLDEKMQKKPKACACMAVLLGQLAVHIDEPQYEQTNPLHGIICDHLRRRLLDHPNQEVRHKTMAAIGLIATTSNGKNYALGVVSLWKGGKVKQGQLKEVIDQAQAEAKRRAGEPGPSSAAGDLE